MGGVYWVRRRLFPQTLDVGREQERSTEALRQEISGIRRELGQDIIAVREELRHEISRVCLEIMGGLRQDIRQEIGVVRLEVHALDHKLTALQFWYWSTLVVIIVGFAKLIDTHL